MWSHWYPVNELREKHGLTFEVLNRWYEVGYVEVEERKPDGLHVEICARIRGFLGANPADELAEIGRTVEHAHRYALKGGGQ